MDKVLLIGGTGQVGKLMCDFLQDRCTALDRSVLDLSNPGRICKILHHYQPKLLINTAAYTKVDQAESEPELANQINHLAVAEMATYCADVGIPMIHYSTDYVFNGNKVGEWYEDDKTDPISIYGKTKLAGEEAIKKIGCKHLILRTSWVYSNYGHNFFKTIVRLSQEREELKIVADQFGSPTLADELVTNTIQAIKSAIGMPTFPSGIYHLSGGGLTSWHGFAEAIITKLKAHEIVRNRDIKVEHIWPINTASYPTAAKRPYNSKLNCDKIFHTFGIKMHDWREALLAMTKVI
jgi:dTDP-4-dehydrorhamnose reductase